MMNFGDAQAAFVGICVAWFSQPSKNPTNSVLLGNNHMFIFLKKKHLVSFTYSNCCMGGDFLLPSGYLT